jgi:thioredoxin reductase (NADPH)
MEPYVDEHDHHQHRGGHQHNPDLEAQAQAQLKAMFDQFKREVPVYLFKGSDQSDPFGKAAGQVLESLKQVSSKVKAKILPLDHELAKKYGVNFAPTILFDPENYNIRWLGAPLGEEARTLIETLMLLGYGDSGLSAQSRKVAKELDGPREVKVFISLTCPYCPQESINAVKAAMARPDLVKVELIDIQVAPALAEKYQAHSTPQAFANEVLIGKGAQPEELFMASLAKLEPQSVFIPDVDAEVVECDLAIIGGGPAGLTAGIYGNRSGLNTVIIERDALGGQVATTPVVENYPGINQIGGKSLVDIMVQHALQYGQIFPGEEVMDIASEDVFVLTTNRRRFRAKAVLLTTGASHKKLGAPGEDRLSGRGVSYCSTCDGPLFKDRRVLMVGGGDSAATEALHLKKIGVNVMIAHRSGKLRAQKHLQKLLEDSGIRVLYNTEVVEIQGENQVNSVELIDKEKQKTYVQPFDGVFISIGYSPAVALAHKLGLEINDQGYIKVDKRHRTSRPGIYAAGDVQGGFKQIVTAAGQGSEAALSIFEDLVTPYWIGGDKKEAAD